mmetsp:Transcript_27836/g.47042  ORF Transcript_27836/g.47042 Transcript_27836/m.47042 type:complete len:366 (+) Transcript_27836:77-1174(+)
MQIGHIIEVLYGEFLEELGARIEQDVAAAMNSASFAGSGQDDDCDDYYDDRFTILEDHYIRPLLHIPRVSALYASPIHHCLPIQSLLNPQSRCEAPSRHRFSFALYKLFLDDLDDLEVPLVEVDQHHSLQFDHCGDFRALLRFYRHIYMEEQGSRKHSDSLLSKRKDADLKSLLSYSAVFLWDTQGLYDKSTAVVVSATQNEGLYVAMSVPAAWIDATQPTPPDHFLAKVPNSPVHLPRAGVSILPLDCLGHGTQLAECWTAVLGRLLLYLPPTFPSRTSTCAGTESNSDVEANGTVQSCNNDSCALSVEQVASLLLPTAPTPGSLGSLHPQPPLVPKSDDISVDNLTDRPQSRPSPNIRNSTSN